MDFQGDGYDSNCNGQSYHAVANAIALSYGHSSLTGSGVCNQGFLFLLPAAAILVFRLAARRRK
jgi:hypothetical protein